MQNNWMEEEVCTLIEYIEIAAGNSIRGSGNNAEINKKKELWIDKEVPYK